MERIGVVGVGIMGRAMTMNLIRAKHEVVVHDIDEKAVTYMVEMGAKRGTSPADVAAKSDVVIFMLPNSPEVREAALGRNGVASVAKKGMILIDMSSINPLVTREIAASLAEKGIDFLDAPVSGGQEKAEKATLAIMVGGDEAVYHKVRHILDRMGTPNHVGPVGAGHTTKLVNQVIVALNIAAIAEGMSLAVKTSVDPEKVFYAIRKGMAGSQALEDKLPRMFEGRYQPGFRIGLHIKDLANAQEMCRSLHLAMPMTAQVMEVFQNLALDGYESLDHGAIALFYEHINKLSFRQE